MFDCNCYIHSLLDHLRLLDTLCVRLCCAGHLTSALPRTASFAQRAQVSQYAGRPGLESEGD